MKNITTALSGVKFFNSASSVETRFHKNVSFLKQDIEESESKISDVLKFGKMIKKNKISIYCIFIIIFNKCKLSIYYYIKKKVNENSIHYNTNIKMRSFKGIFLTTQQFIEFSDSEPFEIVDSCVEEIISCPEIMNGSYTVFAITQIVAKNYLFAHG